MRLSTAIRIGSMTTRPIKTHATDGKNGRCALGAALEGFNEPPEAFLNYIRLLHDKYGVLWETQRMIWTMNDAYGFTREEIADVVEALENLEARAWTKPLSKEEAVLCH